MKSEVKDQQQIEKCKGFMIYLSSKKIQLAIKF